MREILFRGKRKDNCEWIRGSLIIFWDKMFISPQNSNTFHKFEVDPETVGQYIRETDKNRRKIFEGDIVKQTYTNGRIEMLRATVCMCLPISERVYYEPGVYVVETYTYEVVGNIYDNPELLRR